MSPAIASTLILRELRAMRREVDAYPNDGAPWRMLPGLPNSGGTLVLHCAGNLQHFVGAVLGGTGYVRDRAAEFSRREVPRSELRAELDRAIAAVEQTFAALEPADLDRPYPGEVGGRIFTTDIFLGHLAVHLAYHLGQLDYHRRLVAGSGDSVGAMSLDELSLTG